MSDDQVKVGGALVNEFTGLEGHGITSAESVTSAVDVALDQDSAVAQKITMTAIGNNVVLPDATGLDIGLDRVITNAGSVDFKIMDKTGGVLNLCQPGETYYCNLFDNSTAAGSWTTSPVKPSFYWAADKITGVGSNIDSNLFSVALDSSTVLVAYHDSVTGETKCAAVNAADGSIADSLVISATTAVYITGALLSSSQAILLYEDAGGQLIGTVVSFSAGTLSHDSGEDVLGAVVPQTHIDCCPLDSANIGCATYDNTGTNFKAAVINWDGVNVDTATGFTTMDATAHIHVSCEQIDGTNFAAFCRNDSTGELSTFSINWDGAGVVALNEPVSVEAGTSVGSRPQTVEAYTGGTDKYFAVMYEETGNASNEGSLANVRITISTGAVSDVIKFTAATGSVFTGADRHSGFISTLNIPDNGDSRVAFLYRTEDAAVPYVSLVTYLWSHNEEQYFEDKYVERAMYQKDISGLSGGILSGALGYLTGVDGSNSGFFQTFTAL